MAKQNASEDKKRLLDLLADSHSDLRMRLEGIDPELRVHADTGWRIRDIVGHIATWDREAAKSIRAFRAGSEYAIPDLDEDVFNEQAATAQQELTVHQIFAEWERARKDFKAAIQDMSPELFPGDLLYPWGDERGSIAQLVEFIVEHDAEHRDEIVRAIEASSED
ncbi:MAG: DinB family protein [Anaerolineales bacterium]